MKKAYAEILVQSTSKSMKNERTQFSSASGMKDAKEITPDVFKIQMCR